MLVNTTNRKKTVCNEMYGKMNLKNTFTEQIIETDFLEDGFSRDFANPFIETRRCAKTVFARM